MLITDKEAQTKWCPMVRFANGTEATNCTVNVGRERFECIGSDCVMWRWSGTHAKRHITVNGQPELLQSPETRQGYCGLAGKPLELG